MKILAVDPGFGRCGVAVIERINKSGVGDALLHSDCIETPASLLFTERLSTVVAECKRLLRAFEPESMALEKLFFSKNQKTAMQVAEVRGALLNAASEANVPIFEYSPGEIKSAATGSGNADKQTVIRMVKMLITIKKPIKHDDEYDAIAIGITHLAHHNARNRIG